MNIDAIYCYWVRRSSVNAVEPMKKASGIGHQALGGVPNA
jgi:hypothetical protein